MIDDRDVRFGEILAEGFMFGFPIYVVAGSKSRRGVVEVHCHRLRTEMTVSLSDLPMVVEDLKEQLECVELAECYGRCVSVDSTAKSVAVLFDEPWKLTVPLYEAFDVPGKTMGHFGEGKRFSSAKRMRFGRFWVTPIVNADQQETPMAMARHGDIVYVSYRGPVGEEGRAVDFYRTQIAV